jgi:hypothetical protein
MVVDYGNRRQQRSASAGRFIFHALRGKAAAHSPIDVATARTTQVGTLRVTRC